MYYNDRAYVTLGIPPRPEGMSIAEVRSHIHPDDLPEVLASAERARQRPADRHAGARYRRSDGCWRHVPTRRVVQRAPTARRLPSSAWVWTSPSRSSSAASRPSSSGGGAGGRIGRRSASGGATARRPAGPVERADVRAVRARPGARHADAGAVGVGHRPPRRPRAHAPRAAHDAAPGWRRHAGARVPHRASGRQRALAGQPRAVGGDRAAGWYSASPSTSPSAASPSRRCAAPTSARLAARSAGIGTWEMDFETGIERWDEQMFRLRELAPAARPPSRRERLRWCIPTTASARWTPARRLGRHAGGAVRVPHPPARRPRALAGLALDRLHRRPGPHAAAHRRQLGRHRRARGADRARSHGGGRTLQPEPSRSSSRA